MRAPSGQLKRNQIIPKYSAEFNQEAHADLIVIQRKLILGIEAFDLHCKNKY